jgi:hypothetical protein
MEINNNPRKWSSKYWKKNNISDVLKEVIEPQAVDVSTIKMNDTLNTLIWEADETPKGLSNSAMLKISNLVILSLLVALLISTIMKIRI